MEPEGDAGLDIFLAPVLDHDVPELERLLDVSKRLERILLPALAETGILLPNNQRQHRTSHAPKDVLPALTEGRYTARLSE